MPELAVASIPHEYYAKDYARDGRDLVIRAIHPQDKPLLQEGLHHMSDQSLYFRFFALKKEFSDEELAYFTELDFVKHVGLVASLIENGLERPVGVGRYIISKDPQRYEGAELAFIVDEDYQGLGVATILLKHLTTIAKANGIHQFVAFVLPENKKMLAVFRHAGLQMKIRFNEVNVMEITLALD